ncbi:MAG: CHAT domain-containing tetratricopeptide repeat protein [Hyphomicrobiaceae bacterium]|nr:CHAT domain-containing tetratricopeptide repeat protein [Hyphomicrobiaceae bacterium]
MQRGYQLPGGILQAAGDGMQRWCFFALGLLLLTSPAAADDLEDCNKSQITGHKIGGCSRLIEQKRLSGDNLAAAYYQRGIAYQSQNDVLRAIADFSKAIEVNPRLTSALIARGTLYRNRGDRALAIEDFTKASEVDPTSTTPLFSRAVTYRAMGEIDRAIADYDRIIALNPKSAAAYNSRGLAYGERGQSDRAIADCSKAIELDPKTSRYYNSRAWALFKSGQAAQGLPDADKAVELDPMAAPALDTRAHILEVLGRRDDAVADFQQALANDASLQESKDALKRLGVCKGMPPNHPIGQISPDESAGYELGAAYHVLRDTGFVKEAVAVGLRSVQAWGCTASPLSNSNRQSTLLNLLDDYLVVGDLAAARKIYKRLEPAGGNTNLRARVLAGLGLANYRADNSGEAEAQAAEAAKIFEANAPPERSLSRVIMPAALSRNTSYADARVVQALALGERAATPEDWFNMRTLLVRSTDIRISAFLSPVIRGARSDPRVLQEGRLAFANYVRADYAHMSRFLVQLERIDDSFQFAQRAHSSTSAANLVSVSARAKLKDASGIKWAGAADAGDALRQWQDLQVDLYAAQRARAASVLFSGDRISAAAEAQYNAVRERSSSLETQLIRNAASLRLNLRRERRTMRLDDMATGDHDFYRLIRPDVVPVIDAQKMLRNDEAIVHFLEVPEVGRLGGATYAFALTHDKIEWTKIAFDPKTLRQKVAALRCGVDASAWTDTDMRCEEQLRHLAPRNKAAPFLPYDLNIAHELYQALFGPFQAMLSGKHLLIVVSPALSRLPPQVLVTEKPTRAVPEKVSDYGRAAWLGRKQPITIVPSLWGLESLRMFASTSGAKRSYFAAGNPLLAGMPGEAEQAKLASLAISYQECTRTPVERTVLASARSLRPQTKRSMVKMRGSLADVAQLRHLSPLPETAQEICAVAADLKAGADDVRLGELASEAEIKKLSDDGRLADFKVVHFATHGLVSGDFNILVEPALVLTPPAEASERDDGLLTASEVAKLRLDADWVVLSACNTAVASESEIEALNGLVSAFLYSGARAVLASHWEVYSAAAVKLTTHAFAQFARDSAIGRAEALRRSIGAILSTGKDRELHPAYWGPFVVIGEGAR